MKPRGVVEDWEITLDSAGEQRIKGFMFDGVEGLRQGRSFSFHTVTKPPYFETRIIESHGGYFYRLGKSRNEEFNLV